MRYLYVPVISRFPHKKVHPFRNFLPVLPPPPLYKVEATLEIKKKLFDAKGPIGDNVMKNPARNARSTIFRFTSQKDSFER